MGVYDFLAGGVSDLATGFNKSLDDPEFLKYLGTVGSNLSQGKGVGEAIDPTAFIDAKAKRTAENNRRKAIQDALAGDMADAKATSPELKTAQPKVVAGYGAELVPNVTTIGQPGPDATTHTIKPDGTQIIQAKMIAPKTSDSPASQALAPAEMTPLSGEQAASALAPQAPAIIKPQPKRAPVVPMDAPPINPVALSSEDQQSVLNAALASRANRVAERNTQFEAGKIATKVERNIAGKDYIISYDAQGKEIGREFAGITPGADGGGGGGGGKPIIVKDLNGNLKVFDPTTTQPGDVIASEALSAEELDKKLSNQELFGSAIEEGKRVEKDGARDASVDELAADAEIFNRRQMDPDINGDYLLMITPHEGTNWWPGNWGGSEDKIKRVYIQRNMKTGEARFSFNKKDWMSKEELAPKLSPRNR